MKQLLGHDGPPTQFWRENLISGATLAECPMRTVLRIREEAPAVAADVDRHIDELFPFYEEGHLLAAGGIADQPARYVALIRRIRDAKAIAEHQFQKINTPDDSSGGLP